MKTPGRKKMAPQDKKLNVTLTVKPEIWDEAKIALWEMGLSRSFFVEMILKAFLDSRTKTIQETFEGLTKGILKEVTKIDVKEKKLKHP